MDEVDFHFNFPDNYPDNSLCIDRGNRGTAMIWELRYNSYYISKRHGTESLGFHG